MITIECFICIFYASSVALTILLLKKPEAEYEAEYDIRKTSRVIFVFMTRPPRREQPLYKGQMVGSQCVLCSEVLLYLYE